MKFAVLGGGGCFGLNLARKLLIEGHEVIGIGRSALRAEAFTLGTDRLGYRYRMLSIGRDNEFVMNVLDAERPEVIVNFAAQGEGAASFKAQNWKYFFDTNATALVALTEQLHKRDWLRRFIHIGTSEIYGSVDAAVAEDAVLRPSSPYAASKAAFDMHLLAVSRKLGFPALIVRPSNCYTPGQQLHRVIPKAMLHFALLRKFQLHGAGVARKSYLHASDLSDALLLLADKGKDGEIYNVGPMEPVSIRVLVEGCARRMGVDPLTSIEHVADRTGQDGCYWLDSRKIALLGWKQRIRMENGLDEMRDWIVEHLNYLCHESTDYHMRS